MIWDVLNKIAIIGTILGIPATLYIRTNLKVEPNH